MAEIVDTFDLWEESEKLSSEELPFSMEELAKKCIAGEYVLVVGSSVVLDEKSKIGSQCEGDSAKLFVDGAVKKYKEGSLSEKICKAIKFFDEKGRLKSQYLNPTLKDILKEKCFRTIVTTAYDPYLEIYLDELWKKQYKTLNINATEKNSIMRDIATVDICSNEFNITIPMLYYAFGKAEYKELSSNGSIDEFGATDNGKMEIVSRWLGEQAPNNFLTYLSKKRVLAIGCRLDDWLFRFFWYMLKKDINLLSKGEVVFDYCDEKDLSLKSYLASQKIEVFENAQEFMKNLTCAIRELKQKDIEDLKNGNNDRLMTLGDKGIFISYAHEDFWVVNKIYKKLVEKGLNVWMDVRLEAGDLYDSRIEAAIKQCQVFIPVLTSTVKLALENGECENRYFYNKEWAIAENCINELNNIGENKDVIPILTDLFNMSGDYSGRLKPFITSRDAFDLGKQKIDVLINKILEKTNNKKYE